MKRKAISFALIVAGTASLGAVAWQDGDKPASTPEQDSSMQAYMDAGKIGPKQLDLAKSCGIWDAKVEVWPAPGVPAMVSEGTSTRTMVLDGHYQHEVFASDFGGMPFTGHMMLGWDNAMGLWQSNWCDSMSTSMARGSGQEEADGTINWTFTETNPITKSLDTTWGKMSQLGPDSELLEFYRMINGKKTKNMQITYQRRK
jgi:hypothetical protein